MIVEHVLTRCLKLATMREEIWLILGCPMVILLINFDGLKGINLGVYKCMMVTKLLPPHSQLQANFCASLSGQRLS
jgi:hypothetical protein